MVDRAVAHDAHLLASADVDGRRGAWLGGVVAAEVWGGDVRDGCLGVEVVGLADVHPCRCRCAVDNEGREGVCVKESEYCLALLSLFCLRNGSGSERTVSCRLGDECREGCDLAEGLHCVL